MTHTMQKCRNIWRKNQNFFNVFLKGKGREAPLLRVESGEFWQEERCSQVFVVNLAELQVVWGSIKGENGRTDLGLSQTHIWNDECSKRSTGNPCQTKHEDHWKIGEERGRTTNRRKAEICGDSEKIQKIIMLIIISILY